MNLRTIEFPEAMLPDEVSKLVDDNRAHVRGISDGADTYKPPAHGWTCFHCGETFMTEAGARLHFGTIENYRPGCVRPAEAWRYVELLRADEGNSVEIVCDNPDFDGQPNSKVNCIGDWTGWVEQPFTGDSVLQALQAAMAANRNFDGAKS